MKPVDLAEKPITEAVVRSSVITFTSFPGGTEYNDGMVACAAGERVLGGGFDISPNTSVDGQANLMVLDSRRYKTEAAGTVTIWVLCGS